jgi:lysozyme
MAPLNAIIDLSHYNNTVDFAQVKASGIVGVFHKATQGTSFTDPLYAQHKSQATAAGLLWGAYHFGISGDGVAQAEYFLSVVAPGEHDLLALDLEANPQGSSMSLIDAQAFITHVQAATGKYPGLYGGQYVKELLGTSVDPVLSQCWFWLAQYATTPVVPPCWPTWTLWQYTDGASGSGPYSVPGVGLCDRDQFNGALDGLLRLWGFDGATPAPTVAA